MKTALPTRWRIVGNVMIALGLLGTVLMLIISFDSLPALMALVGLGILGFSLGPPKTNHDPPSG